MNEEVKRVEQREKEAEKNVLSQSAQERDLINQLENWFKEAKDYRNRATTPRWNTNLEIHANKMKMVTSERTQIRVNLSLVNVRSQKAIADDYLPSIDIMPANSKSTEYSDVVQLAVRQALNDADFEYKAMDCIEQSLIMSNGITSVMPLVMDGKLYGLLIDDVDVFTCFPAPGATDLTLEDARYIIFATPLHVDQIRRMTGVSVPAEGLVEESGTFREIKQGSEEYETLANSAIYKECYRIDDDAEKYPCGRESHWANGILIKDGPLWEGYKPEPGKFKPGIPYFMIKNYGTSRNWVGVGEPEILAKVKKSLDETVSATADNVKKMGNPPVKVTKRFLSYAKKKIRHLPAEQIEVENPNDVTFEHPIALPQSTFQFIELLLKVYEYESGVQEVALGKRDKKAESGRAIIALQEASDKIVRDKINKPISKYMTDIGRQVLWYFQTFPKDEVELPLEGQKDESGKQKFVKYDSAEIVEGEYKVKAVPGVRLKKGRAATEERALSFWESGIFGIEDVVNDLNIDNKQEVIDGWYKRQGMQETKLRYEEMEKSQPEFQRLIQTAFRNAESGKNWIGTLVEQKLGELIKRFPEFLLENDFMYLPIEYKSRLVKVFLQPPEDIMAVEENASRGSENAA